MTLVWRERGQEGLKESFSEDRTFELGLQEALSHDHFSGGCPEVT